MTKLFPWNENSSFEEREGRLEGRLEGCPSTDEEDFGVWISSASNASDVVDPPEFQDLCTCPVFLGVVRLYPLGGEQ